MYIFILHVFLGSSLCASDARLFFRYTARSLFSSSISDFYSTFSLPGGDDEFDAFYFSRSYLAYASSLSRFLKISSRDMNGCGYFDFCSLILGKSTVRQYALHCSQEWLTPWQPATVSQHIFSLSSCCSTAEVNEVSWSKLHSPQLTFENTR